MPIVRNLPSPTAKAVTVPAPGAPSAAAAGTAGNTGEENTSPTEDLFQGKNVNMALNEIAMMHNCVPEWLV